MSQTLQTEVERDLEDVPYQGWQGNSDLSLSITSQKPFPSLFIQIKQNLGQNVTKDIYCIPNLNSNSETAITSVLRYASFALKSKIEDFE